MSQQSKDRTLIYKLDGEALDQETIVRQREMIEEMMEESGLSFSETELYWNLNHDGFFDFQILFYD